MYRILLLALFLSSSFYVNAQMNTEEQAIKNVITTFFKGLHQGDSAVLATTIHADIKIQTTGNSREGKSFMRAQSRENLLKAIASKKPEDTYLEKLLSYDIKVDGNLASVWTPYEFYYNGNFSHCGANSFQLFKNNNQWQIVFLMDMRRRDCGKEEPKK